MTESTESNTAAMAAPVELASRRCSFCAQPQSATRKLVAGAAAYICEDCVGLCDDLFELKRIEAAANSSRRAGNSMQRMVQVFHETMNQTVGKTPGMRDVDLRCSLIEEEVGETLTAIRNGDMVGAIDGMCDALYVIFGTAVAFGVDLQPYFEEVQRANMSKLGANGRPTKDVHGKVIKPKSWTAPDIAGMLEREKLGRL